jgi:pimeloyl-ACP methyl ester carboxylesterase/uncharacterized protein YciI
MTPVTSRPCGPSVFVLQVTYTAPLRCIDALLGEHSAWLDRNFAVGRFLLSGPQVPRVGGMILAIGPSRGDIEAIASTDPLVRAGAASYDVVEFSATRGPWAPSVQSHKSWLSATKPGATVRLSDHITAILDRPAEGASHAPPMVLVHALGLDRMMWGELLDLLPADRRVLAYDLRGHGVARTAPRVRDLAHWSSDLLEVLDATGVEQAQLVGLSLGGAIAQAFTLAHPERVERLALVATVSTPQSSFVERGQAALDRGMGEVLPETLARWFTAMALAANGPAVRYARGLVQRSDPENWAASWSALAQVDTERDLHLVGVPTRVIAGELDPSTPPEAMASMARAIPGATFHVIPNAPHMISLEAPGDLARLLIQP